MEIFLLTLKQTLMMFLLLLTGFVLRKRSLLPDNAHVTMSRLETCVFVPALNLFTQMTQCTPDSLRANARLIVIGLILVALFALLSYPLSRLFCNDRGGDAEQTYRRNIYKYALTFGNFGFMGNFLVLGIWGDEVFYRYSLFTLFISLVCNVWGLFILIPKDRGNGLLKNLKKGLLTAPTLSMLIGMLLGLLGLSRLIPSFCTEALSSASKCMGPVSMVLAGFVIGGYSFRGLLKNPRIYAATAFRLLLLPAAMMLVLKLLGASADVQTFALIVFATPIGLNTIIYPAAYGGETETGASMAMLSHALSVFTLPLMYLLFIVLL